MRYPNMITRTLGPSPRVRGSRVRVVHGHGHDGSIPACAGKPGSRLSASRAAGVHPRVCGEAACSRACARAPRVHPRVCGEAEDAEAIARGMLGPSPRVRGSLEARAGALHDDGSIPACAGKPRDGARKRSSRGVHPRVCGEASSRGVKLSRWTGPSPRVRGSPQPAAATDPCRRSIPACAGKPEKSRAPGSRRPVHPRVCGEARALRQGETLETGPSPRVRGSRRLVGRVVRSVRSIPACAGKPWGGAPTARTPRVHPRVCGEAWPPLPAARHRPGPSPRVRGSRREPVDLRLQVRSIPACAGKLAAGSAAGSAAGVHPRVCGEASRSAANRRNAAGPSPRVRGSLQPVGVGAEQCGSIPACAGKPRVCGADCRRPWVHPRVCGEASVN